jgi:solute carrier family 35 protein F5
MPSSPCSPRSVRGYLVLASMVLLWVASAATVQLLFTLGGYDKPLALTVLAVGLCSTLSLVPRGREGDLTIQRTLTSSTTVSEYLVLSPGGVFEPLLEPRAPPRGEGRVVGIGLLWFASQLLYNLALIKTSVSTVTCLSSLSCVFTLFFGALTLPEGREYLSRRNVTAVVLALTG